MKRKIIIAIFTIAIFGSTFLALNVFSGTSQDIKANFSEISYDQESLVEKADLIVSGKITNLIAKKTELFKKKNADEADIKCPYSIYDLDIDAVINGSAPKKTQIVFTGERPEEIHINKEYTFFLEKDILGDNNYHLLSYSQGVYESEGEKLIGIKSKEEFSKDSLNEKVKKYKK